MDFKRTSYYHQSSSSSKNKDVYYSQNSHKPFKGSSSEYRVAQNSHKNSISHNENHFSNQKMKQGSNDSIDQISYLLQKYLKYDWEATTLDQLYLDYKQVEKNFEAMIEKDPRQALNEISDANTIREYIVKLASTIIERDIAFAKSKDIEKRLWGLLKKQFDYIIKTKKNQPLENNSVNQLANAYNMIFKMIFESIPRRNELNEIPLSQDSIERAMISNIASHLGEIEFMREKVCSNSNKPEIIKVAAQYFQSINIYPFEGKYYFLLSTCSKIKNDNFAAIYWGVRAFACYTPYTMREKIQEYLEEARKSYNTYIKDRDLSELKTPDEQYKFFVASFLRYFNIILTKIGLEEINSVSNVMYSSLQKYITSMTAQYKKDKTKLNLAKEIECLNQIAILIIFGLHYAVEGYDENSAQEACKAQKTANDIDNSVIAKDAVKYTFGLVYHLIELCINIPDESLISILVPIMYYFKEYQNISTYMISTYKQFREKLKSLHKHISTLYDQALSTSKLSETDVENLIQTEFLNSDKVILGFIPFKSFMMKYKNGFKKFIAPEYQYVCKLRTILNCLIESKLVDQNSPNNQEMNGVDNKSSIDSFSLDSFGIFSMDNHTQEQIENFCLSNEPKETKEKTLIIIDGQNVAIRFGDTKFIAQGLKCVVDYWEKLGHPIQILLPDYCFNKEEVMVRKKLAESKGEPIKNIPDDVNILLELKAKGIAFGIPNWNYDDSYIIEYAKNKNAYIVTNDRYNDHIKNYSKKDQAKKKILTEWIRGHCISFTFIGKDFIPDPDFMNQNLK